MALGIIYLGKSLALQGTESLLVFFGFNASGVHSAWPQIRPHVCAAELTMQRAAMRGIGI